MIEDLKDLDKLLKVLRKQGVFEFEHNGTKIKLGELPVPRGTSGVEEAAEDPYKGFPTGHLTPEQLMFYSAGGVPEDDPAIKATG